MITDHGNSKTDDHVGRRHLHIYPGGSWNRWINQPYGVWLCDDGRMVAFNRCYQPIIERAAGCAARMTCRAQYVLYQTPRLVTQEGDSPTRG